jgi:PucR family transcriptional regulator, purine catabolism regulatory protein
VTNPEGTTLLQPIGVSRPRSRVLVALGPPRLTEAQRSAVTTAVALLSLIAEQQQHSAATYRRLRRRAVDLLVTGDGYTAELLLQTEPTPRALPTSLRLVLASGPQQQVEDTVTALEDRFIVVAESETQLCVVAPNARAAEISAYLAQAGMRVGTGSPVDAAHAPESYRTAGLALAQASPTTPVVEWEHILRQGPLGLIDTASAQRFAASFLGGLDAEQVDTLRCFLRHHGSRLKVAEELGLHRNTVRNRLDAIAAALPGPLDDPQIRASAWIALQATP